MSLPISGFTAVPNPMMLSFLATQGFAIMYYGGAGWQFGKRKVSGMTNEEVNQMSPNDFLMRLHGETRTMVPTMAQGMQDMTPLVKTTLVLFGAYIREAIKAFPEVVQNILGSTDSGEFSNIPTSSGAYGNLPPQMASFLHYFASLSKATQGDIVKQAENPYDPKDTSGQLLSEHNAIKAQKELEKQQALSHANFGHPGHPHHQPSTYLPPVTAPTAPSKSLVKKKAGQSQILERNKLIKEIAAWAVAIKHHLKWINDPKTSGNIREGQQRSLDQAIPQMHAAQQALVNLLDKYRFE